MKIFAISTVLAGGLFASLLGVAGVPHATAMGDLAAPLASAATVLPTEKIARSGEAPCSSPCVRLNGQPIGPITWEPTCQNSSPLGVICYDGGIGGWETQD